VTYRERTGLFIALACGIVPFVCAASAAARTPYGLTSRVAPQPFLHMPDRVGADVPVLLSQTGAFADTRSLTAAAGLIPYELVVAFWSDGALKSRFVAIPRGKIGFSPTGEWRFPNGTVFIKTFELATDETNPAVKRRLETRLLVRDSAGGVYGVVYKWRADGSDADLLAASLTEDIPIRTASGTVRTQSWYYPSRADCLTCHTAKAGGVLGVKTRQMNRDLAYPSGVRDNELRTWNHLGLFTPAIREAEIASFPKLAAADDTSRSLEDRARSYLDANCAQCHRPGGTVASFDARYDTPLEQQQLIDGPVLIDQGIDHPRVISPHDIWRSIAFMRVDTNGEIKMPPLARQTIDEAGVALLKQWILSLPGRDVLDPPAIAPGGGSYGAPVKVTLTEREPGAQIRYTLDGSVPGTFDKLYEEPFEVGQTTIVRARAYKEGFTRSITNQEVFVVGK
jgi:uncharacterized repeat protein (TIGR03806 family)